MRERSCALLLLCVACAFFCSPLLARPRSERVVILQQTTAPKRLVEAIHRLRGELVQHGFEVQLMSTDEAATSDRLEQAADVHGAVASICLIPAPETEPSLARVEVWLSDRVTGKTLTRTIAPESEEDAPAILALRTLELLRSSLNEFDPQEQPKSVEGAHPERAARAVQELHRPSHRALSLSAGAAFGLSLPDGGLSVSPEFNLAYQVGKVGGRLALLGPLVGSYTTGNASADRQGLSLQVEPYFAFLSSQRLQVECFASLGATYLRVSGAVTAPYVAEVDDAWLASLGAGVLGRLRLGARLSFYGAARALFLLPPPLVAIEDTQLRIAQPQLTVSGGLLLSL